MNLTAIDPGEKYTAYATAIVDAAGWNLWRVQTVQGGVDGFLENLRHFNSTDIFIVEDYIVRPNTAVVNIGPVETARLVGAITFWAKYTGRKIVLSRPAAKSRWPRSRLKQYVNIEKLNRHERDAVCHLLDYLSKIGKVEFRPEEVI